MRRILLAAVCACVAACAPAAVEPAPASSAPPASATTTAEPAPSSSDVAPPPTTPVTEPGHGSLDCSAPGTLCLTADSKQPLTVKTSDMRVDCQTHVVPSISVVADRVSVRHCVVQGGSQTGIRVQGQDNVVADNDISAITYGTDDIDGIRFFGNGTRILRNVIHDLVSGPVNDAHPDCVQTWATKASGPSSNVQIEGNHCDPGPTGGHGQCVMAEGPGSTDGGGGASGQSAHWVISGNYCNTSANQAIALRGITDVTVTDNQFTGPNAKAIQSTDGTSGLVTSGNTTAAGMTLVGD